MIPTEKDGVFKIGDGAFVINNKNKVSEYKRQLALMEAKEKEFEQMKLQINTVSEELSEIKALLQILIKKDSK